MAARAKKHGKCTRILMTFIVEIGCFKGTYSLQVKEGAKP